MKNNFFYVLLISVLLIGCSSSDDVLPSGNGSLPVDDGESGAENFSEWLVPITEVIDGGPGKDGIPSIDRPKFVSANNSAADYIKDNDLIIGLVDGDVAKAYPHSILDWHEIVNDRVGGEGITISYCPLTGTGFGWKSKVGESDTTFGVSGLLYNANLILYDRKTDSNWSQLKLQCINGEQIGDIPEITQIIEMSWGTWKTLYPNTEVLTQDTGFARNYSVYPYGNYKDDDDFFIFPVSPTNNAIPNKERVFALIDNDVSQVYQFSKFGNGEVIKQQFKGKDYLLVGTNEYIVGFELEGSLKSLIYTYEFNATDKVSVFSDNEGNKWSVSGVAISGPRIGQNLKPSISVTSYWFAIAAFYPDPIIF